MLSLTDVLYEEACRLDEMKNFEEALKIYHELASKGHYFSTMKLAELYDFRGPIQDYELAILYYKRAVRKKSRSACFNLALIYEQGKYGKPNIKAAIHYYAIGCQLNDTDCMFNLAMIHKHGTKVPKNPKKAARLLTKASEFGMPAALNNLATMYKSGNGVKQDLRIAKKLYKHAASLGHGHACCNLGYMYYQGHGKPKNIRKALTFFEKGVQRNDPHAFNYLGILSVEGGEVRKDLELGRKYFERAAEMGVALAFWHLGHFYLVDSKIDLEKAIYYFELFIEKSPKDEELKEHFGFAYHSIGDILLLLSPKDTKKAKLSYEKTISYSRAKGRPLLRQVKRFTLAFELFNINYHKKLNNINFYFE